MQYSSSRMDADQIAELLAPFLQPAAHPAEPVQTRHAQTRDSSAKAPAALSAHQLDQISIYIDLLLRWNARINLTAIRAPEEIATRHFGESLFAARHLLPCGAGTPARVDPSRDTTQDATRSRSAPPRLIDLGSGAGFPGLPVKIWSPCTPVTLIESNQKKVAFLREAIRALTLTDIDVFPRRAADYPAGSAPLLTLRAVERFEAILPAAARLLSEDGTLALLIGQSQLAQAQALLPALQWRDPLSIPQSNSRLLVRATQARPIQP